MKITITDEILVAYSQCPRKAYLLTYSEEHGQIHELQQILEQNRLANRHKHLDILRQNESNVHPYNIDNLRKGREFLISARLVADGLQADCDILTKVSKQTYEPTIFIGTHSINDADKLRLFFTSLVLAKVHGSFPVMGHIVTMDGKSSQIKLHQDHKALISLLDPLQNWAANDVPPDEPSVVLNKHCPMCQFRTQCETKAVQEDNLSRLKGVTPKVMRQYEKKGIFTVKQLSYLFKPRKRKKRAKNPPPTTHKIELQALACRTGRIYLQELPTLTRQETELFLDIESVPDRNLHYLIGLLVCQGETLTYHSFWANRADEEEAIWQAFLTIANQYPTAPIYHFGNYETRLIARLAKQYETDSDDLQKRMVNVHKQIYGRVYFPVYSNQLKAVAGFVGAAWTTPNASGLQSIVWRYKWEESFEVQYKDMLLIYNEEDCRALKLLVDELIKIQHSANTLPEVDFADQYKQRTTEMSEEISSHFKEILKSAHFDYDKEKISFQQKKTKNELEEDKKEKKQRAAYESNQRREDVKRKITKVIQVTRGEVCPECGHESLRPTELAVQRTVIDLVLTRKGIKKTITQYVGFQGYCIKCLRSYSPPDIRKYERRQLYGHGFKVWIAYQRTAMRLPYNSIVETIEDHFGVKISVGRLPDFIQEIGNYYAEIEKSIICSLLKSPYIHADETNISIQGTNQYVWVFTDGKYVVFRLTETRESSIVHEFLADYKGILISDFYPGYDSVKCRQQKCWVHLIRDLNDDLQENPFDTEYEAFVLAVKHLIVPIMESVQKYGLRKRHLNKFKKDVDDFYQKAITEKQYKSDLSVKYQKRFIRYRASLFTFLENDGIPWHNNTAERAIRPVTKQRAISRSFHASVMTCYLVLLGIRQVCRFQGKSFFRFLFSGETDLDKFKACKRKMRI